jgi:hypothetical protein
MGTGYKVVMPSLRPRKESGLVGAWDLGDPVNGVVYDLSGNGNNMAVGAPACVEQGPIGKGMNFHGISRGTVADAATLDFGTGEFSLEGWFNLPAILDDASGDLASKYDATIRRGFNLGLLCNEGNHNNLFFGMDNNQADGTWTQAAAQLGGQTHIYSLAVWNGALYGGTYPNGLLYRYDVGVGWVQVAAQLGAQTGIRALAVWNGALYGGTDPNGLLYRWQTGRAAQGDTELQAGRHHFAAVRDNTSLTLKLYVDGALLDESEAFVAANYDLDTATPLYIGFGEEDYFKSVIHITEVYKGVARTAGQIRNDYLKARTAGWKTTYDVAVSSADEGGVIADQLGRASSSPAPIFFADTTGRWKIETATVGGATNTKVVANRTTVGTLYIPTAYYNQNTTEAAFGTPEAWFYIPAASICYWMLEASVAGAWNAAGQNGYRVTFDGTTGTISLHRITAGAVAATLYVSGAGVFTAASWFKYTRPRTTAGVFTGKVNDATHNATGGGANPSAADVTYTTSTYQIWQTTTAVGAMVALADKSGGHCMWKGVI